MTTPSDTIARLRAAVAAGPTPGPWSQAHRPDSEGMFATEVFDANGKTIATFSWLPRPTVGGVTETYRGANAEWVAAANPSAIQSLLALLDAQAVEVEGLREAVRTARDHIDMDALEISHCKDAALIRAALTKEAK